MRVIETAHPINALKKKKIWRSTQCWQRGRFAKPLGRRNTVSGVGTYLLRQKDGSIPSRSSRSGEKRVGFDSHVGTGEPNDARELR